MIHIRSPNHIKWRAQHSYLKSWDEGILLRGVIVSSKWKELSPKPTKLRSLSFAAHYRLSRRRSPPPQMTKKKKLKSKSASGSPAGSASSNSSVSRSSAPLSSEIAVEVNSDPSDLGLPGAVTATGAATEDLSTVENGAVTATTSSAGAHENKNLEVIGAVTATDVTTEDLSPIESGVVSATISIGVDRNPNPEIEGAVTATIEEGEFVPPSSDTPATTTSVPVEKPLSSETEQLNSPQKRDANTGSDNAKLAANHWRKFVKTTSKKLEPEGTPFTLDSGEACIKIPNSVIEKNKKAWDSFILGQFYEEPPARGAVHAIVNGIWSKQRRDISVSKMEGHAFLFRVPCPHARRRILSQCLW